VDACIGILKIMYNIWNIARADFKESLENVALKPETVVNCAPTEKLFRPLLRWLLYKTMVSLENSNFNPNLVAELQEVLDSCSRKVLVLD
jgi:hypothetical protein